MESAGDDAMELSTEDVVACAVIVRAKRAPRRTRRVRDKPTGQCPPTGAVENMA
jgi:hypothetical protein